MGNLYDLFLDDEPGRRSSTGAAPDLDSAADRYGVPRELARALVGMESGGRDDAVSPKGARGRTQVMPDTMREMGYDPASATPEQYVDAGMGYLRKQYDRFGRWDLALAAYHAGPGAIRDGQIPDTTDGITRTPDYVRRIMGAAQLGDDGGAPLPEAPRRPRTTLDLFLDDGPAAQDDRQERAARARKAMADAPVGLVEELGRGARTGLERLGAGLSAGIGRDSSVVASDLADVAQVPRSAAQQQYEEQLQAATQAFDRAQGFAESTGAVVDIIKAVFGSPTQAARATVESLASSTPAFAGAAAGALAGAAVPLPGASVILGLVGYLGGSLATNTQVEMASRLDEKLRARGVDTADPQATIAALEQNPTDVSDARSEAIRAGLATTVVEGVVDLGTVGAARALKPATSLIGTAMRAGAAAGAQGLGEGLGAAAGDAAAGDPASPGSNIAEGLMGIIPGIPEAAGAVYAGRNLPFAKALRDIDSAQTIEEVVAAAATALGTQTVDDGLTPEQREERELRMGEARLRGLNLVDDAQALAPARAARDEANRVAGSEMLGDAQDLAAIQDNQRALRETDARAAGSAMLDTAQEVAGLRRMNRDADARAAGAGMVDDAQFVASVRGVPSSLIGGAMAAGEGTATLPRESTAVEGDGDWRAFGPESGSMGVPRADMPQIRPETHGPLVNFLKARGVESTLDEVPAGNLRPTQAEYSPAKVESARAAGAGDKRVLVSSDGYVVDGHHRWLAAFLDDAPVKVIRLDAPVRQLLDLVREFPSAGQADGGMAPAVQPGMSDPLPGGKTDIPDPARAAAEAKRDDALSRLADLMGGGPVGGQPAAPGLIGQAADAPVTEQPTVTKERTPAQIRAAQERRENWTKKNPFLAFLGRHGVSLKLQRDIVGETGRKGNRAIPYHGPMFRKLGLNIDLLAERAAEERFLSPFDLANPEDNGGTRKLADMILRAFNSERVLRPDQEAAELEQGMRDAYDDYLATEQEASLDDEADADPAAPEAEYDAEQALAELDDDQINALFAESGWGAEGLTDDDLEAIADDGLRLLVEDEAGDRGAAAPEPAPADAGGREGSGPPRDAGGSEAPQGLIEQAAADAAPADDFALSAQTPEELRATDEARRRDEAERARRDAAPPPDDFVLTGSDSPADQARARGQMELGEVPAPAASEAWTEKDVWPTVQRTIKAEEATSGEELTPEQAQARLAEWKAEVDRVKREEDHSQEVVISLFDYTGRWSKPWRDAGYQVAQYDIKRGDDLLTRFPIVDIREFERAGFRVVGVLAAPPCTSFASSGARWWKPEHDAPNPEMVAKKYGPNAAKFFDTPLEYAKFLVAATELVIAETKPEHFWAVENPIGRFATANGLPAPRYSFDPHHFGDDYTKRTQLWGKFDTGLPTANVHPERGSLIHTLRGNVAEQKSARSDTPEGFAYAFFMANHRPPVELTQQEKDRAAAFAKEVDARPPRDEPDAIDDLHDNGWKMRLAEYTAGLRDAGIETDSAVLDHRDRIEDALDQGKKVPREVLADHAGVDAQEHPLLAQATANRKAAPPPAPAAPTTAKEPTREGQGQEAAEAEVLTPSGGAERPRMKAPPKKGEKPAVDKPAPTPPPKAGSDEARMAAAQAKAAKALDDLANLLGTKKNMTPEQQRKLLPILVDLMDALATMGTIAFKQLAREALDRIRRFKDLGPEVADQITLRDLQSAYLSVGQNHEGSDDPAAVFEVRSLDELGTAPDASGVDWDELREMPGYYGDAKQPLRFASGMSRVPDFTTALEAGQSVGVEVGELSERAIDDLGRALAENEGAYLFVDTGAFSVFRANQRAAVAGQIALPELGEGGRALDFDDILDRFARLDEAIAAGDREQRDDGSSNARAFFVMPDIVGDQAASIELAGRYREEIQARSIRAIVPLQKGALSPVEAFDALSEAAGRDVLLIGVPSNERAFSIEDLRDLVRERGDRIEGLHFLGAASDARLQPKLDVLVELEYDGNVSADANRLRALISGDSDRARAMRKLLSGGMRGRQRPPLDATRTGDWNGTSPFMDLQMFSKAEDAYINTVVQAIHSGKPPLRTVTDLRALWRETTGLEVDGRNQKRAEELAELAIVLYGRDRVEKGRALDEPPAVQRRAVFEALSEAYEQRQPTLGTRTSTSVEQQAYSTPLPLAFLASELAGIGPESSVYEPTAGNGMLLIGANPENVIANELNGDREAALRVQDFAVVSNRDASTFVPRDQVDVVIANPPFGAVRDEDGQSRRFQIDVADADYSTTEIDHAIAFKALQAMKDDGRAVLIVGSVAKTAKSEEARAEAYNGAAKRQFFYFLYRDYNVTQHFTVSGDLYRKQGAAWPVDVIVIEGRGRSERALPAVEPPRVYDSWDSLKGLLDEADRLDAREPASDGRRAGDRARPDAQPDDRGVPGPAGDPGAGVGRRGGAPRGGRGGVRGDSRQGGLLPGDSGRSVRGGRDADPEQRQPAPGPSDAGRDAGRGVAGRDAPGAGRGPGAAGGQNAAGDRPAAPDRAPPRAADLGTNANQVGYTPTSKVGAIGTLMPVNMQQSVADALAALRERVGDIDDFVAKELGYSRSALGGFFGAEQVDALALAIDSMNRDAGFVIGDQTGIGKGRVVAGVIRWALKNGKTPIFVTEKPNLYGDMYRDLTDIGVTDIRPVMTNQSEKIPLNEDGSVELRPMPRHNEQLRSMADSGLLDDANIIFTTYSQMQFLKGAATVRNDFLARFAEGGVVIFDESHNAGGQEASSRSKKKGEDEAKKEGRAGFARRIAASASAVFYSSATWAKRPEVMDLYFKTDMALAVGGQAAKLPGAIQAGGVPLQQVVSSMLAKAGQYIRRERSFNGVEYNTTETAVDHDAAEAISRVMLGVAKFDQLKQAAVKALAKELRAEAKKLEGGDVSIGQAGATSTNFTSIMHNLIDQMLLSLKVDAAVDIAIGELKAGRKPVLTVANTMGSFIEQYVSDMGLQPGDSLALSFRSLLLRYLQRSRFVTIKDPGSKVPTRRELTDRELGPQAVAAFKAVEAMIENARGLDTAPISPIDYIHHRLRKAGYRTGEITGRTHIINYSAAQGAAYETRKATDVSIRGRRKTISGFNGGDIDVIVLNQAGSTGLSLHASEKFKDQRPRSMLIVQPERNIDTHMQMLGRVHRTGQVVLPRYFQLVADIPAEKRPAAVLAKKMASLNANTTANRKSAVTSESVVDFMNDYGDEVAAQLMTDLPDVHRKLGSPLKSDGDELSRENAIARVTGRIPLLPLKEQEELYALIESGYTEMVDRANALGENMLEAQTLELDARTVTRQSVFEGRGDSPFAAGAFAEVVDVKRLGKPYSSEQARALMVANLRAAGAPIDENAQFGAILAAGLVVRDKMLADVYSKARAYEAEMTSGVDDPEDLRAIEARLSGARNRWELLARDLRIGASYRLQLPGGANVMGYVAAVKKKEGVKNPVAAGAWQIQFALADAARTITVPMSKIAAPGEDSDGKIGYELRDRDPITGQTVAEGMDAGQSASREQRVMMTGNLLAAFGKLPRGQIVNYTDDQGAIRQGILMPRGFDLKKVAGELPLTFPTVEAIRTFLNGRPQQHAVETSDELARLVRAGYGYMLRVPKAKSVGGTYFLDAQLRGLSKDRDFVSRGDNMVANFEERDLEAVVKRLEALSGERLQTSTFRAEATSAGAKSALGGDRPAMSRRAPDASVSARRGMAVGGMPIKRLTTIVNGIRSRWLNAPDIEVVGSAADLPDRVRAEIGRQEAGGAEAAPQGVYWNGTVYLVADQLPTEGAVVETLLHETLGHYGLRGVFGARLNPFLDRLALARPAQMREKARDYGLSLANVEERRAVAEELLAEMAQTSPELDIVQRAIAAVRAFLRDVMGLPIAWSDADIIAKAILPARRFVETGARPAMAPAGAAAASAPSSTFYSELARRIGQAKASAMPAAEWARWLDANAAKLGVKADEVEWSGIREYLALRGKERTTKEEILDFLGANGVQVDETVLGTTAPPQDPEERLREMAGEDMDVLDEADVRVVFDSEGDGRATMFVDVPNEVAAAGDRRVELAIRRVEDLWDSIRNEYDEDDFGQTGGARYSGYRVPGGEDYREMLLTLPSRRDAMMKPLADATKAMLDAAEEHGPNSIPAIQARQAREEMSRRYSATPVNFRSGHWDEPNVLVHTRFDTRTDAEGRRVLFVHEIQSDWGQEGRKRGFGLRLVGDDTSIVELEPGFFQLRRTGRQLPLAFGTREQVEREALAKGYAVQGTPRAPFVTDTKAWVGLALKRLIRYAAESGHERVVLTTGEQAAETFDLSKQIDVITYDQANFLRAFRERERVIERKASPEELPDLIGKEIAERLLATPDNGLGYRRLEGLDLKVGGEGMKAFYDRLVPQVARDVVKKIGAGNVGVARMRAGVKFKEWRVWLPDIQGYSNKTFDNEREARAFAKAVDGEARFESTPDVDQVAIDITPELRSKAMGGLPMFAKRSAGARDASAPEVLVDSGDADAQRVGDRAGRFARDVSADNLRRVLRDSLVAAGVKAPVRQRLDQGLVRNAEVLRDATRRPAFAQRGYRGLDVPTKRVVVEAVLDAINDGQVLRAIVEALPVDVVNVLRGQQRAAERLRGDMPVLPDVDAVDADDAVSAFVDVTASVVADIAAGVPAELAARRAAMRGVPLEGGAADVAREGELGQGASDRPAMARGVGRKTWDATPPSKMDDLIYTLQDRQIDMKRIVQAVRAKAGQIADRWNPYLQEELYHGRTAKRVKDFLDFELRPLLADMQSLGVELAEFERYLHARHAEERNIQVAKINPKMPDGGSGMTTADARAYLAAIPREKLGHFRALATKVDAITKGTRDGLVADGLEKKETIAAWSKAYKEYVPLMREEVEESGLGTGMGFSVRGPASRRAMGSDKGVVDIIANLAMQRERAIIRAEKNRVATALYGLAVKNPNTEFWKPVNPRLFPAWSAKQKQKLEAELLSMGLDPVDAAGLVREPVQRYVDPRDGLVHERVNPALRGRDNVLSVRVNGEDRFLFFNATDERAARMAHSLKNLDVDQLGRVLSASAVASRWFASVNTQYNPIFGVVNLTRDVQSALFNLSTTPIAGKQAAVLGHTVSALRGIYADIRAHRAGKQPSSSWAQLWEEFQREGGQTGFRDMWASAGERTKSLESEIRQIGQGKLRGAGRAMFAWLSDYNETLENATRLAAYRVALDQGISKQQAASIAKNLTVNFNRKGQITQQAGALYAFFNASVQGTARLAETLRGPMGKKIIAGGLILGVAQAMLLAAAGFDDDDPPDFVRERNVVIPIGGQQYVSIPMPLGLHVLPGISRITTEWVLSGFRKPGDRVAQLVGMLAETFNPIGNAGLSLQTITPTVADPLAALAENKDFSGRPIARENVNSLQPKPGFERTRDTASWVSKQLAYWLNLASGGTEFTPGLLSPTPDQIDYLVGQVTGGVGRELLKAQQTAGAVVSGEELPPYKMPLAGRFYGDASSGASESARFFDNLKTVYAAKAEMDGRRRAGESSATYMREHPESRLVMLATQTDRDIDELRKARRDAAKRGASADQLRRLDDQIKARMAAFNRRVEAVAG